MQTEQDNGYKGKKTKKIFIAALCAIAVVGLIFIPSLLADGDIKTVAVHINRLREKLEKDPANPEHIQTVWGSGYRFLM